MEKNLIVLNNAANGIFITHNDKIWPCQDKSNTLVANDIANAILNEYIRASFVNLNVGVEIAETYSFIFYKFYEDKPDDITWVEEKGKPVLPD